MLLGVTSGSFVFLAVGELRGKFREVRFSGALIALICLAVGGCVSVLHMGHPERATHLLGNLGSGLSKELFVVAIMGIIALVYL
ncbi:MAG: DmsC/YnfH family molybdoenzyme membrane anchor subunit, partial [Eggerthella lenta]